MFKKKGRSSKPSSNPLASMLGFGMPEDDDEDDEDLEAELAALEGRPTKQKKADKSKDPVVTMGQIDAMAAEGLRDIDEDDISDEDIEDEDLLSELADITGEESPTVKPIAAPRSAVRPIPAPLSRPEVKAIEERKRMYERAIEQADTKGEGSKVRRYKRMLKTVEEMLTATQKGKSVNLEELPPPIGVVSTGERSAIDTNTSSSPSLGPVEQIMETDVVETVAPPSQALPKPTKQPEMIQMPQPRQRVKLDEKLPPKTVQPRSLEPYSKFEETSQQEEMQRDSVDHVTVSSDETQVLSLVNKRQLQYKQAALRAKSSGDTKTALSYMKTGKLLESMAQSLQNKTVVLDIEKVPPPPPVFTDSKSHEKPVPQMAQATSTAPVPSEQEQEEEDIVDKSIPTPKTVLEALEQRLAKYEIAVSAAKEEGQTSKARRMGRILKQYQEAIRACKAKKQYNYEELPTPPGYPPIPRKASTTVVVPKPSEASVDVNSLSRTSNLQPQTQRPTAVHSFPAPPSASNQQLELLLRRQTELKKAAMKAKGEDREKALDYLRSAKSMDQMIEAARSGIRVDMSQMPSLNITPPVVDTSSTRSRSPEDEDVFTRLETRLQEQVDMANRMTQHYNQLGHIQETAKFGKIANDCQHDLDAVTNARSYWLPVPKFHYEDRSFPLIRCCPELDDSEAEVVVVRGINLPQPEGYAAKDLDTYVTVEFPYPTESPPKATGSVVKGTVNPDYNQAFKFKIDRKQRALARTFKRRPVKVEIWFSRGFLHRDKQLGEASIKVEDLDTKCEVHASVSVMDNRKSTRGKLELKVRLREPLQQLDVDVVKEKWLIIDHAKHGTETHTLTDLGSLKVPVASGRNRSPSPRRASAPEGKSSPVEQPSNEPSIESIISYQILKGEAQAADQGIAKFRAQGRMPPGSLLQRAALCKQKCAAIQKKMSQGGKAFVQLYVRQLEAKVAEETTLTASLMRSGKREEAKSALTRKKKMEGEIANFKSKFKL